MANIPGDWTANGVDVIYKGEFAFRVELSHSELLEPAAEEFLVAGIISALNFEGMTPERLNAPPSDWRRA